VRAIWWVKTSRGRGGTSNAEGVVSARRRRTSRFNAGTRKLGARDLDWLRECECANANGRGHLGQARVVHNEDRLGKRLSGREEDRIDHAEYEWAERSGGFEERFVELDQM
jgi:hypothetical protein